VEVAGGERERKLLAWLVVEELHRPRHLETLRETRELAVPCAEPDHHDPEPLEVAEERRRPYERVEILGVPDVARVHDDELVAEPACRGPGVLPGLRLDLGRVDPVGDHLDPRLPRALVDEAELHRLADRHDPVGAPQVEPDELPERSEDERVLEPLDALRDLGEHVLADDEERGVEPPGDHEPDVPDDRRVGHAEDEVGPLAAEGGADGLAEVAAVVRGPVVELRALVGRRPDADDPDAVPLLLVRQLVAVEMPGDDGDVVVAGQRLAELREQLRGRLDAGPVVLVQDEDPRAHAHRPLTLTHAPRRVRADAPPLREPRVLAGPRVRWARGRRA
jgi:hypothetical protein